jgi:imidazolonepropionase-like amidohydrolase
MPGFGGGFTPALTQETLKLWVAIYEGKTPLFANAANAAAIVHLLKAVAPYKDVKLVLTAQGPALYETLDHLAGRHVRIILRPGLSLKPNTRDRIDVAHLLHEAGVEFAFTQPASPSDLLAAQDFPLFSVAYVVRCGLPRKAALEALTARAAALLGLDKTHGTIEPGKSADLLVFTGDPLDPTSQLSQVLIEGRTVYEN